MRNPFQQLSFIIGLLALICYGLFRFFHARHWVGGDVLQQMAFVLMIIGTAVLMYENSVDFRKWRAEQARKIQEKIDEIGKKEEESAS